MRLIEKIFSLNLLVGFLFAGAAVGGIFSMPTTAQAQHMTWGKITNPAARFQVLANFNNEAVLDRETGLIWEQCPNAQTGTWAGMVSNCYMKQIGGRYGWRLPSVEEVLSLGTAGNSPFLPNSAPFCNSTSGNYWTSTTTAGQPNLAYLVEANPGDPFEPPAANNFKDSSFYRSWCVRGGQSNDSGL